MYGRVRISGARGRNMEFVQQFDRTPLRDVAALGGKSAQPMLSAKPAMSLTAFESAVVAEVARQAAEKRGRQ